MKKTQFGYPGQPIEDPKSPVEAVVKSSKSALFGEAAPRVEEGLSGLRQQRSAVTPAKASLSKPHKSN